MASLEAKSRFNSDSEYFFSLGSLSACGDDKIQIKIVRSSIHMERNPAMLKSCFMEIDA